MPVPVLVCRVGDHRYALPLEHVVETMRLLPLEPSDGTAAVTAGWSVIRGLRTPIVSLAALVGADPSRAARLVTVRIGERRVALGVDAVVEVVAQAAIGGRPRLLAGASQELRASLDSLEPGLGRVLDEARLLADPVAAGSTAGR